MNRPKKADAKRSVLTMRIGERLRDQLTDAAGANNRSISKEVESRLQSSFGSSGSADRKTDAFLKLVRAAIEDVEERTGSSWLREPRTWSLVKQVIDRELQVRSPAPNNPGGIHAFDALLGELQTAVWILDQNGPEHIGETNDAGSAAEKYRQQIERIKHQFSEVARYIGDQQAGDDDKIGIGDGT